LRFQFDFKPKFVITRTLFYFLVIMINVLDIFVVRWIQINNVRPRPLTYGKW